MALGRWVEHIVRQQRVLLTVLAFKYLKHPVPGTHPLCAIWAVAGDALAVCRPSSTVSHQESHCSTVGRRLTDLSSPDYDAIIALNSPLESLDSQYGDANPQAFV